MKLRSDPAAQSEIADPPSTLEKAQPKAQSQSQSQAQAQPLTLLTLPDNISAEAWITTFTTDTEKSSHPPTSVRTYICCPKTAQFLEITEIDTAKDIPRSWLLAPGTETTDSTSSSIGNGYVSQNSRLHVATPIDPLFLLIPALMPSATNTDEKVGKRFLALDDYEDILVGYAPQWAFVLQHERLKLKVVQRLRCICDVTMAGEEKMYRPSMARIQQQILAKARKIIQYGLPCSLELEFVQKVLQLPQSMKSSSNNEDAKMESEKTPEQDAREDNSDEHKNGEAKKHSPNKMNPSENTEKLRQLQRLKIAIHLVLSYTEPHIQEQLLQAINDDESINFKPLESYLAHAQSLRQEATALRAMSDNISRKRPPTDEILEAKAEKKRKKEEEEKKKKLESRGVKNLKKVNTTGMMKLNSFFSKAG